MVVGDTFVHEGKEWRVIPAANAGEYWPDAEMLFRARIDAVFPWTTWFIWARAGARSSGFGVGPHRQYAVLVGDVPRYDPEFPEDE